MIILPDFPPTVAATIARTKAPDGLPWPKPHVAVDSSEQTPIAFGHVPAMWEESAPVHYGQIDELRRPLFDRLKSRYPWRCERAKLGEGDYQLVDPRTGAPIPRWAAVETKRADLVASLTVGHDRLESEMARLAPYAFPALVASCSVERLVGADGQETAEGMRERAAAVAEAAWASDGADFGCAGDAIRALSLTTGIPLRQPRAAEGKEVSLIGSMLALSRRYRIPWYPMPTVEIAEYTVAWLLLDAWRTWLVEVSEGLAACRVAEQLERKQSGEAVPA